ncbi:uncharacterized protein J7T54_006580 [Emericellopsis cladophorae]|uniref:Uncharacterized protein n=1 Tax=Emericellopsis cladophorae TaxID=2686198 RepID=A0A9Q0BHA6_9HYPO|nr:uncharacterized protein J7T54_006580 [Emericellopsis cladophorae]KAI6784535.1 hypothetical protein J7T54_006580 [Emericellopsis cladophorae]
MNRLRGRKKAKDEAPPRPSVDSESSGPFKMFGRSKKPVEENAPQVDLASALPPTDDFRTSLLMTGLSARFSMLREQDDPASKLGKASDDSVLQPKRQSRMDFGLGNGLDDIAEDSSFRNPPFARMDSYQSDDAASLSGSIMNRAKPTEGNNLFGGRQKIYKISATGGNGRTLYDDDVAQSSFQRWRQTEKERSSLENERAGDTQESGSLRPESPHDFSRRRETSSTMSSNPSAARDSTAATSIASQPASSAKDWQASSATPAGLPERSVTRTRRLYEQSLAEGMQDHQSSALSRIDTLSKGRFNPRTPDLASNASTPSGFTAFDRNNDRRPMISKASAPNLRSFSPPNSVTAHPSPAESTSRFPTVDAKTTAASPPLSPPISETEEYPTLSIGANDRGKATSLGFLNRPAGQYDENRYAQRQRQLQQGRETPTSRHRTESNGSQPTSRSRSSSSVNRSHIEQSESAAKPRPTIREEVSSPTFLNVGDEDDDLPAPTRPAPGFQPNTPQVKVERPADQDHPAFRQSPVPTPLTISRRTSVEALNKPDDSPEDSPTLGPGPAGLSGMVRQHLRNVSNASSVYDNHPQDDEDAAVAQAQDSRNTHSAIDLAVDSNPWGSDSNQWEQTEEPSQASKQDTPAAHQVTDEELTRGRNSEAVSKGRETDEFARNLADGAKRVRERLTSYVESDHSRSTSPVASPVDNSDLPPPRTGAFSALRSKSSSRSAREPNGERERSRSAARKVLGLGSSSSHAPMPTRPSVDDGPHREELYGSSGEKSPTDKDEGAHAGLKAFRQARRELQRMKELETKQRRQAAPTHAPPPPPPAMRSSLPSQDRGPPPVSYNRNPSADGDSRPGSVGASERDRSGSEASNTGGASAYRPRLRTTSSAYDESRAPNDMRSPQGMSPYSNYDRSHIPMTSSTPNLALANTGAPPPLPPINPRRKGMGSPHPHDESGTKTPMSPASQGRSPSRTRMVSDDDMGPGQYRQRLRKVPSEANGVAAPSYRSRANPSYENGPRMPLQPRTASSNSPGGMF